MAILEEMEAGGQLLAELPDDTDDNALRAGPLPDRLPGGDGRAVLHRLHLGAKIRRGLRGDHGDEPVQLDLRAGVRCAVRACVQADGFRRPSADPQPQALRHGRGGARLRPAARAGAARAERGGGGLGPGRADGGARALGGGLSRARLRDDGSPRRDDDLGHPGVPPAARDHPGGYRPHGPGAVRGWRFTSTRRWAAT